MKDLKSKKIAVIGFGSQGKTQALNLRDSGFNVVIGLRKRKSWKEAKKLKFKVLTIPKAVKAADIILILIPDEVQKKVYEKSIAPYLSPNQILCFAHGFAITFKQIIPPKNIDVILVSPNVTGKDLREQFGKDFGVPSLIGVFQDYSGKAKKTALTLAKGIGLTKSGLYESSFETETFLDLFSEQVIIGGGLDELIKQAFDLLIKKNYSPELAYIYCIYKLKLLSSLIQNYGIEGMYSKISNTAEFGARTAGKKIIAIQSKKAMAKALKEIESGRFAKSWLKEFESGFPKLKKFRKKGKNSKLEKTKQKI